MTGDAHDMTPAGQIVGTGGHGRPMRFCTSLLLILPRQSSTAVQATTVFIDEYQDAYEVESICKVLPIAPSNYYERVVQRRDLPGPNVMRP